MMSDSYLRKRERIELIVPMIGLLVVISIGTFTFHILEQWSIIDSFYFSIATMSTVGYGDFIPSTELSRLFASFYILISVTVALATIGVMGRKYIIKREKILERKLERRFEKKKTKKN